MTTDHIYLHAYNEYKLHCEKLGMSALPFNVWMTEENI